MSIELVLDNREHHLIEELKNTPFLVEQLQIGDILFRQDGVTLLVIERKTIADLKASICDGRGREQKARLLGSGTPTDRIMYLIEGNMDKPLDSKVSGLPISTLLGSIINTQLRDNIKVYKTASLQESALYIIKLLDKLTNDGDNYFKEVKQTVAYSTTLKKSKKANMTPEVWFTCQLAQIPQITDKVATVIVDKYKNVGALLKEYQNTPEHLRVKLVADLVYPIANGKTRRVGDKISTRIYKFMHGIDDEPQDEAMEE